MYRIEAESGQLAPTNDSSVSSESYNPCDRRSRRSDQFGIFLNRNRSPELGVLVSRCEYQ
jgi:hypothetical protein